MKPPAILKTIEYPLIAAGIAVGLLLMLSPLITCSAPSRGLDAFMVELNDLMRHHQARMYRTPVSINFMVDGVTAEWRGLFGRPESYGTPEGAVYYDDPCHSMLKDNNAHWQALLNNLASTLRESSCVTRGEVRELCRSTSYGPGDDGFAFECRRLSP